ncbi:SpoIIE family protein phosphatase [Pseudonocardia sp. RS010]|uniref:SpoIIE family protein phosphatase n=1 Tax=Pseudonocardia sp. RS010 TaxID=3385979 RepID=UPI0039A31776
MSSEPPAAPDLPFPVVVTVGSGHVVSAVNEVARRELPRLMIGRAVAETSPEPELLAALDRAVGDGVAAAVDLVEPSVTLGCVPTGAGVLLYGVPHRPLPAGARARGAALQRLAGALLAAPTPEAIGRVAVATSVELLGADAGVLFTRAEPEALIALFSTGWPADMQARYRRVELRRGRPLSDAVLDGAPVWIEDAAQWAARYPEMAPLGTAGSREATACLPLRVEGRDLGAMVFSFGAPRRFLPDERAYLEAVAALCAQALERARLLVVERSARTLAERERDRMKFLARTGQLMEAPLSVEERLQRLADLVVPELADWCAVHLVRDNEVEQIAVAHDDPAKLDFVLRLQERYPPDPSAPGSAFEVTRTGEPAFFPEIPDELLVAGAEDAEHLALIRSIGMSSALVVPLTVRGRSLGALTLVHAESGQRFDELDLAFAQQIAAGAAVALDNARLYEQQRRIAHTLQAALLPTALPDPPGLRLAARYRPQTDERATVQVGGDLYDVVATPEPGRWAVVVADVCGKGPDAAALTALIRHTLRAEVAHGLGPVEALLRLNEAMLREARAPGRFATVAHAHISVGDDGTATVTLAGAGHPPALLRRHAPEAEPAGRAVEAAVETAVEVVAMSGTLLGVFADVALSATTIRLGPGDMMVLYTDGVTEARGVDGFYGLQRLTRRVGAVGPRSADALAEVLLSDIVAFQQHVPRDDIALLVIEVAP